MDNTVVTSYGALLLLEATVDICLWSAAMLVAAADKAVRHDAWMWPLSTKGDKAQISIYD